MGTPPVSRLFWAASFVFCDLRKNQYFGVPIVVPTYRSPRHRTVYVDPGDFGAGKDRRALFWGMLPLLAFWPGIATALLVSRGGAEAAALRRTSDWRMILGRALVWCQWNLRYILWIVPGTRKWMTPRPSRGGRARTALTYDMRRRPKRLKQTFPPQSSAHLFKVLRIARVVDGAAAGPFRGKAPAGSRRYERASHARYPIASLRNELQQSFIPQHLQLLPNLVPDMAVGGMQRGEPLLLRINLAEREFLVLQFPNCAQNVQEFQPRSLAPSLASGRMRSNCRLTCEARSTIPLLTMADRPSGGIRVSTMLQPTQPARRASLLSGFRFSRSPTPRWRIWE